MRVILGLLLCLLLGSALPLAEDQEPRSAVKHHAGQQQQQQQQPLHHAGHHTKFQELPPLPSAAAASDQGRLQCLEQVQGEITDAFRPIFHRAEGEVALVDLPTHANLGDHLLSLGQLYLVAAFERNTRVVCGTAQNAQERVPLCPPALRVLELVGPAGLVLLSPGGNWGDVWEVPMAWRLEFFSQLEAAWAARPDLRAVQVVQLPQSVNYIDRSVGEAHAARLGAAAWLRDQLTVFSREASTLDAVRRLLAPLRVERSPDVAFMIGPQLPLGKPAVDVLVLARTDREGAMFSAHLASLAAQGVLNGSASGPALTAWTPKIRRKVRAELAALCAEEFGAAGVGYEVRDWLTALKPLDVDPANPWHLFQTSIATGNRMFSRYRAIVTDRLHATILAALLGKPCFWFDNSYGKLARVWSTVYELGGHCQPANLNSYHAADLQAAVSAAIEYIGHRAVL